MAPLSLFRLKKQSNHNPRRPQNIVVVAPEPLSPDSFFSPDRSPSLYAADFVLGPEPSGPPAQAQDDQIDEQAYPQQEDVHGAPRQQPLFPQHTDLRDIRPPSLPVSALSAAHTITPGPPNLALRLSFDAEGSLGDSIERYFMSSRVDGETGTSAESLRRFPDPGAGAGRVGTSSQQPPPVLLLHQVENVTVNTANHPTRGPIIPSHHPDSTANLTTSDTNYVFISLTNHHAQPNSHDRRSLHSKLSSGNSDDRSLHESPVLHASDRVLDISPSASRVDLPPSPFKPTIPAPTTPVVHKLPLPPPPEHPPPVPPKNAPGPAHRKRGAPAPIKIPNGSMHAPKVIVERVPAEQSTTPTTVAPPLSIATATTAVGRPRKPQRHAGRKRSVEEIEHSAAEQVEEARKEVVVVPRPTRPWTVASSRKSTASAFFACEYDEFTLPPSSGGDRLSVVQPPTGRADSATLPEDSPGWQAHRFIEDDKETANVPPVPALPQTLLRWTRTLAPNANANNESTRVLVVPKRDSSLLPSAISAKLLPIALRQSDASATSEAASSSTFSQFISGYQHRSPSPPQDAVSIESGERKSVWSDKARSPRPGHTTTASMASEAELTIARTRTASPAATQPSTRGPSPSGPMTPAGILGLEKTGPIPSTNTYTSRPPTVSPVLHSVTPPRNKSEDTDAPPLPRDGSSQAQAQAQTRREWRSPRTDSLRPSRAVELLKASRDSAVALLPSVPPTPGTGLTQYLDMYTNTEEGQEGQDKDGTDDPASTGSSSFSTGPSSLFGTSAAGRSPYSLYQGTTPGSGQCTSSTPATSKTFVASATAVPAHAAAASPGSTPSSSSSSSVKPSRLHIVPEAFNGNGCFRARSVSDAPPASAVVPAKNTLDRRPSLPESSTPGAADPLSAFFPDTLSAVVGGRGVMGALLLKNNRSETSLRSTESTRPTLPTINTNPPPPRDLRESMFPHTPHSFSPEQPNLDQLLDDAKPPGVGVGVAAVVVPPPVVIVAEPAPTHPKTPAETRASVLSNNMSRSYPSLRGPMSSSSSVSSFYRRDRTLPIGPRKPTIKRKGAEQEASRPATATTSAFQATESNAVPRAGIVLPTPVTTPPGQASSKSRQRERSTSISPHTHTHSRTRTKSSASTSTSASASVMEKIARPATPTFDTTQVQWRGLTLDAAKWMFSSQELHAMVGRAIRQSADPMCIRLLPTDLLDRDLPAAVEDLEVRREEIKAKYIYLVKRRRTLMRGLAVSVEGTATPVSVLKLVEELSECTTSCDRLSEELYLVSDQIAQIGRLRDGHSTSALAMALRKINTSFLRATGEVVDLKAQVETLTAEREEAWAKAEEVERDLDELRSRVETMEQQNLEQQQQRQAIQFATSPLSRSNSRQGCLSRSTSRVSAARKSSMRVSKASLRSKSARSSTTSTASWRFSTAASKTPATSSPLFLVPPVPRILRGSARNSDSADGYTPSPRGTPRALIDAQNELLEMLGIPIHEFKNGSFIPAQRRRSHSAAIHSWAKSPPASPLDRHQPPASPVPIPKAPPASKLFRSASIAEHARLSRRRGEAYSTVDMEMIYDGILDDPETLFAVLKN